MKKAEKQKLACLLMLAAFTVIQYIQLELSYKRPMDFFPRMFESFRGSLLACGTILLATVFFILLTMRIHVACFISACLFFLLSVVNHFVFLCTSELFSFSFLSSVRTGMNVLQGYSFSPDWFVLFSAACFLAEVAISSGIKKTYPGKQKFEWKRAGFFLAMFVFLFAGAVASNIHLYKNASWIFNQTSHRGGYITFFVQRTIRTAGEPLETPRGYSPERLETLASKQTPLKRNGGGGRLSGYYPDLERNFL